MSEREWVPILAGDQWWPFFVTFYFLVTDILCIVIQYFGSKLGVNFGILLLYYLK